MTDHTPAAVVQRQLDAYDRRDIDALLAVYADDARQFEFPVTLAASGSAHIRARMRARFQEPHLHARLVQRAVMGNVVIDQEVVTRTFAEGGGTVDVVAIYEGIDGRIASATVQVSNKCLPG